MMQSDLVDKICSDIGDVDNISDLRLISATVKRRREWLGLELGAKLQRGDKVRVSNGSKIEHGTVIKVNRTRAVVEMKDATYNVPFSMITKEKSNGISNVWFTVHNRTVVKCNI